ncbi:Pentatricopeptide repeat-containing protein [Quillaja saponaria]|uniref:Pentatricopeptide repeat-containing protein n=1 Tax=Quillaja saponaria TaxID=32244 RepID=A0AAD7PSQ3_QUISA|nr:Pentatricopeptide repeat-containing protein [Quillaja saponaria]
MDKNLIIPRQSRPSMAIPSHIGTQFELFPKSTKPIVSFTERNDSKLTDIRLNYICKNGPLSEAISVIDSIAHRGSKVRPSTYINLLESCIETGCVEVGRELHARIGLVKEVDCFVQTKVVSMYAKCGYLDDARKMFDEMRERNLFTWSAMIGACSRDKRWREVVDLFFNMMEAGVFPDDFLLPKILQACGNCGDFEAGKLIHSLLIRCGMNCSLRINNSILTMYAKGGKLDMAKRLFDNMDKRDRVTWNAIISGYCQKGEIELARKYFDTMHEEGIEARLRTWNILIASYSHLGHCDVAMDLMRKMESFGITPDVFTWTSIISGFAQNSRTIEALVLLGEMLLAGIEPTGITITSAASACASLKSLNTGVEIHSVAVKMGFVDHMPVGNSLIDMYCKCGELETAQSVFDMMLEKDIYTWNSMIGGYCQAGYCGKAHELFMKMQDSNVPPNIITWNAMISGYIKNGDEDQAMDLFQRIEKDSKIKRNTASWNSLISGYLQFGQTDKALGIFRQMQSFHVRPNSVTMLSLLPACANLVSGKKVREIHGCALRRNLLSERAVANSLIDTYAKTGNIMYPRAIFDGMSSKDIITWNSLIAGYVLHGCSESALSLFDQMRKFGPRPSRGTFASIIYAYSLVGMVDEGMHAFSSIVEHYQIRPGLEHYSAVTDLLGRSGRLVEAMEFIENMPVEPDSSIWAALLTACRIHKNYGLAIYAGERLLDLEPKNFLIHKLLLQMYALFGKSEDPLKLRKHEKENTMVKPLEECWMEFENMVYTFVVSDRSKPCSDKLLSWIQRIAIDVKRPDPESGIWIEEEDKEDVSGVHCEKWAFAFALIDSRSSPQSIRIVKNLRMCRDCHRTAKYISKAYGCEIYLSGSNCFHRGANYFHHFKHGHCSCQDYW